MQQKKLVAMLNGWRIICSLKKKSEWKFTKEKEGGEGEEGKGWQHASCQIRLPNTANVPFCYLASWKIIELVVFTKEWTKLHVTQVRCLFTSLINLNSALHVRAFYYQCDNSGL